MRILFLFLLLLSSLNAQNHTQSAYSEDYFMDVSFDEIVRFDSLEFEEDTLSEKSDKYLQKISQKIKQYSHENKEIVISIIGHTSPTTDNDNEKKAESKTYAKKIQIL